MNILFIGKYPPIEGGTASAAYWRHNGLKKYDIEFEVVTCISNESEYLIPNNGMNEKVHVITERIPWHIPYSQLYAEQLISKALVVATNREFDAVEGSYLFPFGFAAYVVAKILKKPLILRHAGSDLHRIISTHQLDEILRKMTDEASVIVTYKDCEKTWKELNPNAKLFLSERYVPNPSAFYSGGNSQNAVFLGKITEKWDRKQFDYYLSKLKEYGYDGAISVYSNEYTICAFIDYFKKCGFEILQHSFVLPQDVPDILRNAKYVLLSEIPSGIPEESNLFSEAMMCGCKVICSNEHYMPQMGYHEYIKQQLKVYEEAVR